MISLAVYVRLPIAERSSIDSHVETDRGEKIRREEYKRQTIELRQQGLTYRELGKQIGISRGYACNFLQEAVRELHAETQLEVVEYPERDWQITEMLLDEYVPSALDGDMRACDRVLKLPRSEQRPPRKNQIMAGANCRKQAKSGGIS